jgi:subtilisin family serine protease
LPNSGTNHLAYTGHFGGTSFACPVVAGIAALMLSVNPSLTPQQVFNTLISTANKVGGYTYSYGRCNQMGFGRVNAYAAVQAAQAALCVNSYYNKTVTTNTTVKGCNNLNVETVTVTNNAKLTLNAPGTISIAGPFNVREGSSLEVK